MENIYLSIVVPAYNESARISKTLVEVDAYLKHASFSYEIVVVDDGSTDTTVSVVQEMQKRIKNIVLVINDENKGKGGVVKQGMLLAKGKIRLFMDADNSTAIDQCDLLMPYIARGYDVVIGSRIAKGAILSPPESFLRQCIGRVFNAMIRILLFLNILDTQCGFKIFTAAAAEAIFSQSKIYGWGFDVELLSIAKLAGYRVKEVPVRWKNAAGSHVRLSSGVEFLGDIFKIRWQIWNNEYSIAQS